MQEPRYVTLQIEARKCTRRFHLAFEEGGALVAQTKVDCPHCGLELFRAENHPEVILSREENLVGAPDGSRTTLEGCLFPFTPLSRTSAPQTGVHS